MIFVKIILTYHNRKIITLNIYETHLKPWVGFGQEIHLRANNNFSGIRCRPMILSLRLISEPRLDLFPFSKAICELFGPETAALS